MSKIRDVYRKHSGGFESTLATVIAVVVITLAFALLIGGLALLSALITKIAWNYGVVAIVAACGGHVAKISLVTALCFNIAWGIVTRPFRRMTTESA